MQLHHSRIFAALAATCLAASAAACGSTEGSGTASTGSDGKLDVAVSFYPIQWLVEHIGGDDVTITSVTPANVEPHDFELSPAEIAKLDKADALIYVKGFQSSLDEAAEALQGPQIYDLSPAVDLVHHEGLGPDVHYEKDDNGNVTSHTHDEEPDALDPHFWLDPTRMSKAADEVTKRLSEADPDSAETYKANAEQLKKKLSELDSSYSSGLKTCERRDMVTTHTAFGYLADRYKLTQVALSGLDPEAEPSPAVLSQVKKFIQDNGTTTIFSEALISPKVAENLASETGIKTDVLDPLESQPEGEDYLGAMDKNLTALRGALDCS
ncbi:MAG: metal ABC transporter substrate-binding protein [Actinomycetaceae bacterium]|nr:metal ABC transporter substrate-binding protein [Actinomycetaceae bacterium]